MIIRAWIRDCELDNSIDGFIRCRRASVNLPCVICGGNGRERAVLLNFSVARALFGVCK